MPFDNKQPQKCLKCRTKRLDKQRSLLPRIPAPASLFEHAECERRKQVTVAMQVAQGPLAWVQTRSLRLPVLHLLGRPDRREGLESSSVLHQERESERASARQQGGRSPAHSHKTGGALVRMPSLLFRVPVISGRMGKLQGAQDELHKHPQHSKPTGSVRPGTPQTEMGYLSKPATEAL